MGSFDGYRVVITGGGSGLGAAAARRSVAEGARVVVADIDEAAAIEQARVIDPGGTTALGIGCDISKPDECERLVQSAEAFLGGPIDLFVANAGIGFAGKLTEVDIDYIRRPIEVNVLGSIFSARAALPSLVRSERGGNLIFTSSLQAVVGRAERSVYVATKHAIVGFMKALALEYGPQGVRVNSIAPGSVVTSFFRGQMKATDATIDAIAQGAAKATPLGHLPTVEDFADAVVFLGSAASRSITGHTLMLDSGATAGPFTPPK